MSTAPELPLLRCTAGGVPLALPAEEVAGLGSARTSAPTLATLLGLGGEGSPSCALHLRADGQQGWVRVEGPVLLRPVADRLLPLPRFFSGRALGPVIGFCEEDGRVVVLLDVRKLLGLLEGRKEVRP